MFVFNLLCGALEQCGASKNITVFIALIRHTW